MATSQYEHHEDNEAVPAHMFAPVLSPGKSTHMDTVKSLGLLHDLQDYISTIESLAAARKQELDKLREEKRDVERVLYKERYSERVSCENNFLHAELTELPPRLRALLEDSKVMKDKIRKYKTKSLQLERQLGAKDKVISGLELEVQKLKQQIHECSRTPAEVEKEAFLKLQLDERDKDIKTLAHKVSVLQNKSETDARTYRQTLTGASRENSSLKKQISQLTAQLEEKDKEIRAQALELRKATRKLAPGKQNFLLEKLQASGVATPESQSRPPEPADPPIHLMLCVVREEIEVPVEREPTVEEETETRTSEVEKGIGDPSFFITQFTPSPARDDPTIFLQSLIRGFLVRKEAAALRKEQAAVLIQAQIRGYLARKDATARSVPEAVVVVEEPSPVQLSEASVAAPQRSLSAKSTAASQHKIADKIGGETKAAAAPPRKPRAPAGPPRGGQPNKNKPKT